MSLKLDHVGHVVKDFNSALDFYKKKLGLEPYKTMEFHEFGSRMAFFKFAGTEIELIDPGGGQGPAAQCLRERGEGLFHLSLQVDDYEAEIKKWKGRGFTVDEMSNEAGGMRARLAFLRPEETHGLYIEFIKEEKI
jgi:methylmalonyl-CoA/ethylmalonyl-CoA epimerase